MTEEQKQNFKEALLKEKVDLEKQLASVGRINPQNKDDWEAVPSPMNEESADKNEAADTIEEYESNTAVLKQLETRYNSILYALKKFESGTYGICEVSGKPIEEERLNANPAARTCIAHIGEEKSLI